MADKKELSESEIAALDKKFDDAIRATRMNLLVRQPFFGYISTKFRWMNAGHDSYITTAGTDGRTLWFNPKFFLELDPKERVFVVAHELYHCILLHFSRVGSRNRTTWNFAADFAINWMLNRDDIGKLPKMALFDAKYKEMTAEQIYGILEEQIKKLVEKFKQQLQQQTGQGEKQKGENGDEQDDSGQSGAGNLESEALKRALQEMFGDKGTLDNHMYDEYGKNNKGDALDSEMREIIVEAYQYAKTVKAGKIPGEIAQVIESIITPKINWRAYVRDTITSIFRDESSWVRRNRRTFNSRIILPSRVPSQTIDLCVAIDASGSISDDMISDFLGEIAGILKQYNNFKLTVWSFDTKVHENTMVTFQQHDIEKIKGITKGFKVGGRGGTAIESNFEYLKEKKITPKQLVVFTDGYNGSDNWGPAKYCPTLWIIHSNPGCQSPFGKQVIYDEE